MAKENGNPKVYVCKAVNFLSFTNLLLMYVSIFIHHWNTSELISWPEGIYAFFCKDKNKKE